MIIKMGTHQCSQIIFFPTRTPQTLSLFLIKVVTRYRAGSLLRAQGFALSLLQTQSRGSEDKAVTLPKPHLSRLIQAPSCICKEDFTRFSLGSHVDIDVGIAVN